MLANINRHFIRIKAKQNTFLGTPPQHVGHEQHSKLLLFGKLEIVNRTNQGHVGQLDTL